MSRKLLLCALIVLSLSCCAFADGQKIGLLGKSGMTEEEYANLANTAVKWTVNEKPSNATLSFKFYDDLPSMLMGLNAGEIDSFIVTKASGEYITNINPSSYKISGVIRMNQANFAFGFMKGKGEILQKKFNYALGEMRKDGTLEALRLKYFLNPGKDMGFESAEFEKFPDGETVKVALTGDVPPLDFVAPDGKPGGFNTAVLAEIGRRLGYNIEMLVVSTASRIPALASGRADVVFWIQFFNDMEKQPDVPSEIIVSEPYYSWDIFLKIGKK